MSTYHDLTTLFHLGVPHTISISTSIFFLWVIPSVWNAPVRAVASNPILV